MAIESSQIEPTADDAGHEFERLAEPFRREIKLHCYRMLGSLHEAEDLVQESYLRAWRNFGSFDGGSMRAWLYKIATNACLNAIESRKHQQRYLPDQLGPAVDPSAFGAPATDIPWLEPYPDANLDGIADTAPGPEAHYTMRESVQLAFVAAIQQLPPRQRAALMLCDVLGWASAEAAALLDSTTASVNSALQRARETISKNRSYRRQSLLSQPTPAQQKLLGRYLQAWEGHNVDHFVSLLKQDAAVVMPPWLQWLEGRETIGSFFAGAWKTCGGLRLVPTAANGQPAFAVYEYSDAANRWNAHSIHSIMFENDAISRMTIFIEPRLFDDFGLPQSFPRDASTRPAHPEHES
jgi:RNA polymerase sigma-70 factor (ECF subfamily)